MGGLTVEGALEIHDYLPLAYPSANEGEYIRFIWESFESNYQAGKFQFAMLAFHMLYMSFVYFSVWQIKQARPGDFANSIIFFKKEEERGLQGATSPFTFSEVNERSIFKFLRLAGCENQRIGQYQKLVDMRNEIAHPNGNIFFNDQTTADKRIEEVMAQIRGIQAHMTPVLHICTRKFLHDSADPDEREYAEPNDQVEQLLLHRHYLSRKDIEACMTYDLGEFAGSPFHEEVRRLMNALESRMDG
jgi:hypothetical protein